MWTMRTSEEIYHRVRWDARFDPSRFTLGILVRGASPKRVPLPSFVPGGDIPWHRVLFVEADGEVVWDRASGVDRLDGTSAGRSSAFFSPRPVHGVATGVPGAQLRVLTWNTLWDRYDSDLIDTARRRPLLLRELVRADADVIALQEVEPALYEMLALAGYAVSDGADVADHGLVLLSRLPVVSAGHHALSGHKGVASMVVSTAAGPVAVLATHLTSDHHPYGPARRDDELARLAVGLSELDCPVVLLGDFNGGPVERLGLVDAWSAVRGDEAPTFDPSANPLAAISSLSGRAGRLDRVLVRGVRPVAAALLGTVAPFASDHFGVAATLEVATVEGLDVAPTVRTAVAWVPPEELWEPIQRVRAEFDPKIDRWPPHVNVLYGFVPESSFEEAAPLLSAAAASVKPFGVRLSRVREFAQGTAWLDPGKPAAWARLWRALVERFPRCRGRETYTPHLTLGRGVGEVRLPDMPATVGTLVVLSRRGPEPMRARMTVELGTGDVRWLPDDGAPQAHPATESTEEVVRRVADALPDGVVHLVGSRRMGCARAGADVDLVAVTPAVPEQLGIPGAERVRPVVGARVPGFRFRLAGLAVDLTIAAGPGAETALSAVTDADAILAAVDGRHDAFATLARTVKAWAAGRGLDSAPHGGLPGIAWAVLAARTTRDGGGLADFFGQWAAWDWREPVTLLGDQAPATGDAMTIMTPTAPARSCTEQVGPGMRDLITAELYAAWEGAPATPPHRRHAAWAVVTVTPLSDAILGRVRGRIRALLSLLPPDAHAWPAPFEQTDTVARYAIGLGGNPPSATELAALAAPWDVPDTSVEWTGNGEVPTLHA
jgi:poly(A) polymerase